jgi:hypothetical protein
MKNDFENDEDAITIPRSVTIILFFVLFMTGWGAVRVWTAVANWDILIQFKANPFYIFATGIIWFILGAILILLIFKGHRHTLVFGLIGSLVYGLWYWFDRLVMQAVPAPNVTFSMIGTIITLVIFNTILFWPSSQAFFKEPQ